MKYKKGDVVKVWSLQSFFDGGFLNGVEGIVRQDQNGSSVLVAVRRKIRGKEKIDPSYEVYAEQLKFIRRPKKENLINEFSLLIEKIKGGGQWI